MILLEVRLEWRCAGVVLRLVTERGTSAERHVIIVLGDMVLALLHAPEDKGDATEKKSTTDSADHAADDFLVAVAYAATVVAGTFLRGRWVGDKSLASSDDLAAGARRSSDDFLAVTSRRKSDGEWLERGRD